MELVQVNRWNQSNHFCTLSLNRVYDPNRPSCLINKPQTNKFDSCQNEPNYYPTSIVNERIHSRQKIFWTTKKTKHNFESNLKLHWSTLIIHFWILVLFVWNSFTRLLSRHAITIRKLNFCIIQTIRGINYRNSLKHFLPYKLQLISTYNIEIEETQTLQTHIKSWRCLISNKFSSPIYTVLPISNNCQFSFCNLNFLNSSPVLRNIEI